MNANTPAKLSVRPAAPWSRALIAGFGGLAFSLVFVLALSLGLPALGVSYGGSIVSASVLGFLVWLTFAFSVFSVQRGGLAWRHAMDHLHTMAGIAFGSLAFIVFFMGSLSVFDKEIDQWMMPSIRLIHHSPAQESADALPWLSAVQAQIAKADSPGNRYFVSWPDERSPFVRIGIGSKNGFETQRRSAENGELLAAPGTLGASRFFFPFHFSFHIRWGRIGYWLLAVTSVATMMLLIGGVVVHRKLLAELLTFRSEKSSHRATTDFHNLTSLLVLPFHFMITLSGLVIFASIYWQPAYQLLNASQNESVRKATTDNYQRSRSGVAANPADLSVLTENAQEVWRLAGLNPQVARMSYRHPGDASAYAQFRRRHDGLADNGDVVSVDAVSGEILHIANPPAAARLTSFLSGFHMLPLRHWGLRCLYFLMGLASCAMIASGFVLWVQKRYRRRRGPGWRTVNIVGVSSTLGLVNASVSMMLANRLLPLEQVGRARYEVIAFIAAWVFCLLVAILSDKTRPWAAWRWQAWLLAPICVLAVIANALSTAHGLPFSLTQGHFAVAGTDIVLLIWALAALYGALALSPRRGVAGAGAVPFDAQASR